MDMEDQSAGGIIGWNSSLHNPDPSPILQQNSYQQRHTLAFPPTPPNENIPNSIILPRSNALISASQQVPGYASQGFQGASQQQMQHVTGMVGNTGPSPPPSAEDDRAIAERIIYHKNLESSKRAALDSMHMSKGYPAIAWKDYYLERAWRIDRFVEELEADRTRARSSSTASTSARSPFATTSIANPSGPRNEEAYRPKSKPRPKQIEPVIPVPRIPNLLSAASKKQMAIRSGRPQGEMQLVKYEPSKAANRKRVRRPDTPSSSDGDIMPVSGSSSHPSASTYSNGRNVKPKLPVPADSDNEDDDEGFDDEDLFNSSEEQEEIDIIDSGTYGEVFGRGAWRIIARWLATHPGWQNQLYTARWQEFAEKYDHRTYKSWANFYGNHEVEIDRMALRYAAHKREKRRASSSQAQAQATQDQTVPQPSPTVVASPMSPHVP